MHKSQNNKRWQKDFNVTNITFLKIILYHNHMVNGGLGVKLL